MMHFRRRLPIEMPKRGRSGRRSKFVESSNSGVLLYLKFLLIWAGVLTLDFLLEFRFEYLWPCWLLLRSLHDSYRYQGVMFLLFFLCLGLTSDVILYLFVPVHWLFFLASTYVWVQFVWNSERGVCIPTILLWTLFVYVEFSVRLRQMRNLPFNIDLCRPFAAHSIGYPIVTLGFGFKTYLCYRYRLRKQHEVRQRNSFHFDLLDRALGLPPAEAAANAAAAAAAAAAASNGGGALASSVDAEDQQLHGNGYSDLLDGDDSASAVAVTGGGSGVGLMKKLAAAAAAVASAGGGHDDVSAGSEFCEKPQQGQQQQQQPPQQPQRVDVNLNAPQHEEDSSVGCAKTSYKNVKKLPGGKDGPKKKVPNMDPCYQRLETDVKRLRGDLQSSRSVESELRSQLANLASAEKQARMELTSIRQDNESLQNRLHNLVQRSQTDKTNCQQLEKKLTDERKVRQTTEAALERERRAKEELVANLCTARQSTECTSDQCRSRRAQLEAEVKSARRELRAKEELAKCRDAELRELAKMREESREREVLMTALNAMKEKNAVLDQALRDENKMKQDLLSALHKARRDIDYFQSIMQSKDREMLELKALVAAAGANAAAVAAADYCWGTGLGQGTSALGYPPGPSTPQSLLFDHQQQQQHQQLQQQQLHSVSSLFGHHGGFGGIGGDLGDDRSANSRGPSQ